MAQNKEQVTMILTAVNAIGGNKDGLICLTAITLVPKRNSLKVLPVLPFGLLSYVDAIVDQKK